MSDYVEKGPDALPIESIEQLVGHFEQGCKPRSEWTVGTEYEKPAVDRRTGLAIPFDGPRGVEAILRAMADRFGWEPQEERGRVVALSREGGGSITLEPGGQVELSGHTCRTLHETRAELVRHAAELTAIGDDLDVAFLGLGITPVSRLDQIQWVPKARYDVMGPYMLRVGSLGQRMMKQTTTVQANLDFESESDAMAKMRVAMGTGAILNAIFANSPISDGAPNGFLSYRGHVWTDTDSSRSGLLPFVFEERAGFEDYVDWALDVPMYFVRRGGAFRDMTGLTFRRFWKEGCDGLRATVGDFALHLSTLFPDARLKTYIELRTVDSQPPETMLGLPAIAKGVLYEPDCLAAAWDLVKDFSWEERQSMVLGAQRAGLAAPVRRWRIGHLAKELVSIAEEGLRRQNRRDARGDDERVHLESTRELVLGGRTRAERILELWNGAWNREAAKLVEGTAWHPMSVGA